jgi:3-oxoadipate enol-lactonase
LKASVYQIGVQPEVYLRVSVAGRPDAPPIMFSNSLAASLEMWDEVVDHIGSEFCIIRYDTRGHGMSSVPVHGYAIERLGHDVLAVLDALGIRQTHFCGLSLGGLTGMWLGAHAGDRLLSLTLANTAPHFPPPGMWHERATQVRERGMEEIVSPTIDRWLTKPFQETHPRRTDAIGRMIAETPVEGYAGCCAVLADAELSDMLPRISCPTCVITGRWDISTPRERAFEIATKIPDCVIENLEAAHLSAVEVPDQFAKALKAHIEKAKSGAPQHDG